MTALLIALVGALAFSIWVTRIALDEARRARRDVKDANTRAEHAESMKHAANAQAYENRLEANRWKQLHDSLLKRQQNRRDAAVQPLTGVIPDARD